MVINVSEDIGAGKELSKANAQRMCWLRLNRSARCRIGVILERLADRITLLPRAKAPQLERVVRAGLADVVGDQVVVMYLWARTPPPPTLPAGIPGDLIARIAIVGVLADLFATIRRVCTPDRRHIHIRSDYAALGEFAN